MLGGKSVNGVPVLFSYEESVPYHLYWQVLNAKHHGVPQNRERVFLIGIRDDADNKFQFPREEHLPKRLKDVLEDNVDDKYFLSEKMIDYISSTGTKTFYYKPEFLSNESEFAKPITTKQIHRAGTTNYLKIKSATSKGYEEAKIIKVGNLNPSGIGMNGCVYDEEGISPTLWSGHGEGVKIQYNIKRLNQTLEKHKLPKGEVRFVDSYNQSIHENSACINARINATNDRHLWDGYKIRRLTPRECFRLMDFPDTFTWKVSDSQAYKQAGNSIVVNVLYKILKQLPL
jgi:DNA (cytosine-5)-methyltransferase 1